MQGYKELHMSCGHLVYSVMIWKIIIVVYVLSYLEMRKIMKFHKYRGKKHLFPPCQSHSPHLQFTFSLLFSDMNIIHLYNQLYNLGYPMQNEKCGALIKG